MDFSGMSMYWEYDMIDDIEFHHFPRKFKVSKLESIGYEHDRFESHFFSKSKHREEVTTNSDLSSNNLKVSSSILFGSKYIGKNLSWCCIDLSFIEVDTKTAFYIAGISSKDDRFLDKHKIFIL